MTRPELDIQLATLNQRIETLRAQLAETPETTDIKDLQPQMEALLARLHELPPEQAHVWRPRLEVLAQDFAELASDYRRLMLASMTGMQQLNTTAKANAAYTRSGAVTGRRGEEDET